MQCRDNAVNRDARGAGVPNRERTDFVGVDVFGDFTSSAKRANASRASTYRGTATSTSTVRSPLHCERVVVHVRCTLRARFEPMTFLGKAVDTFRAATSMQVCE